MKPATSLFYFLAVIFAGSTYAQKPLEERKLTREISMKVPSEFVVMSENDRINKYVSDRAPIAMFNSTDRQVDLGVNINSTQWGDDLKLLKEFYKASILNLFSGVQFISDEIREVNGRKFIVFEFIGTVADKENTFGGNDSVSKYIFIEYTLFRDQVLLFNFSCPARLQAEWQETAREVMSSVKIR